ncbi:MAG TPA: hypothetical protein VNA14_07135 [Mycobacteriales bacterium]|nr:hypothetical protein [Mycobacteriales bacterium]
MTMAVDERARHELSRSSSGSRPAEAATTLLEYLRPVGWADVATKHDLAELERRMDLRFELVDARFDTLEQRVLVAFRGELVAAITTQTRSMVFTMAGTVVSLAAVALAATRAG